MSATASRSSVPSAATMPSPKRSTMAANVGVPGCCTSRVMASASTMTAPLAASSADTVDLPDPMPPVRPMTSTCGISGDGEEGYSSSPPSISPSAASIWPSPAGSPSTGAASAGAASAASAAGGASPDSA